MSKEIKAKNDKPFKKMHINTYSSSIVRALIFYDIFYDKRYYIIVKY